MRRLLALLMLASCVSGECPALPPPPDLPYPVVWNGVDDQQNPIVIMTPQTWIALQANIQHARIWMRHANVCAVGGQ